MAFRLCDLLIDRHHIILDALRKLQMSPDNVLDVMEAAVVVPMFVVVLVPVGMLMLVVVLMPVGMLMLVVVFVPMGVFVLVGMFVNMFMGGRFLPFLHPVYCHMHVGSCDAAFY